MEKENKKNQSSYLKKERQRIINLVNLAYALDPRIKEEKRQIELEK